VAGGGDVDHDTTSATRLRVSRSTLRGSDSLTVTVEVSAAFRRRFLSARPPYVPLLVALASLQMSGQQPPNESPPSRDQTFWIASATALGAGLLLDRPVRTLMSRQHGRALDDVANAVDPLGTARTLVPALVISYGLARVAGRDSLAARVLGVALGYAASDALAGLVRSAVGRARLSLDGNPWRLRPFSFAGTYSSFPSGHVVHIASLATGIAERTDSRWVTTVAAAAVALVGAQRVHRDQHWTSDVMGGAVLGVATATASFRWMQRRDRSRRSPMSASGDEDTRHASPAQLALHRVAANE
jgi:undecaprenyl-diphosphatase